jgi:hypothetical protein
MSVIYSIVKEIRGTKICNYLRRTGICSVIICASLYVFITIFTTICSVIILASLYVFITIFTSERQCLRGFRNRWKCMYDITCVQIRYFPPIHSTSNLQYDILWIAISIMDRDSAAGIPSFYWLLKGPRIESQWREILRTRPYRPWGPPGLLYSSWGVMFITDPHQAPRLKKH